MADIPLRTRKRDKFKKKLGLDRSAPRETAQQSSHIGASSIVRLPASSDTSSPAAANTVSSNVEAAGLTSLNTGLPNTTDSRPISASRETPSDPAEAPGSSSSHPHNTISSGPAVPILTSPQNSSQEAMPPSTSKPPTRDLWAEALKNLSPDGREAIERFQPTSNTQQPLAETMEELLRMTREVQAKCKAKVYKIPFGGKDVILRDFAGKIIFWLNKFKDIGDIAVNFDPIHASLPWAGVRLLLQAATAEHEQMGDLVFACEKLSCLISRGAVYERLYQPRTIPKDIIANLHHALIGLYAAVLRMIALCHGLFLKNTAKRALHAFFHPGDVKAELGECEKLEAQVEYEANNCERARSQEEDEESKKLLHILQQPILRTDKNVLSLLEKVGEKEQLEVLDWLSKVLYGKHHKTVKERRTANTCGWLLDHSRYQEWQQASGSIVLWLCGTAGTGKTFLTSSVIDEIQAGLRGSPNQEGFAFFYCNRNETERQEPLSMLRAFVRQLSTINHQSHSIQKCIKDYYNECRLKASEPTMGDCKEILLELVNIYPRTTLVVDALDECEKHKRLELIETIDHLLAEASNPVKIFISSRPDGDIKERSKDRANIEINATDNHDDISKFVNSEIVKHRKWTTMPVKLKTQIVETLQQQSQGMFQWAFLQIKQILELQQPGEIEKRLGKLPKDLKLAYDEIYNGMTEHERKIADRAFQWVMCAAKPLNTRELLPALCQDGTGDTLLPLDGLDEELALEYCHNLLVIDPVRKVWVPSHLSVIEYIEDHLWSQRQANSLVSSVCLLALQNTVLCNREEKWIMPDDMRGSYGVRWNPLSERIFDLSDPLDDWEFNYFTYYARHYWVIHAKKSAERGSNHRISTLVDEFLGLPADSSPAYRCWMRMVIEEGQRYPAETPQSSIFRDWLLDVGFGECIAGFVYCAFDLFAILPDWHDFDWVEQDQRTGTGQTFLELAAQGGAIHTCWELVKHGAEVNAQTNSRNGSPLAAAISNGQENVVEFLLKDGGADVNMQLKNQHGSALATASFQGQENMVRLLVKQGEAEVNMQFQNGFYGSALAVASYEGEWEIVKFLVKEGGAEVNMQLQYGEYGSALAAASYGGGWEVVKFLVKEGGAEVNMQLLHGEYGSALAAASYEGDWEVVKFLVKEGGAEVNMQLQHREYGSALAAASYGGDCEVVEFLVKEGGAEVNMQLQYGEYGSALAAASHGGHQEVIKFLIEEGGAEVNMQLQHGKYANALDAAEKWEWDEAAELLIKLGAERKVVEDKDNNESNSDGEWVSYADPKSDEE